MQKSGFELLSGSFMVEFFCIITTIQPPTNSVLEFIEKIPPENSSFIIVGDQKGPSNYHIKYDSALRRRIQFINLQEQLNSDFELARKLPVGHYSRKNIGYLWAIVQGADCIYETDDDNAPLQNWQIRKELVGDVRIVNKISNDKPYWINVYRYFANSNIWPRGLPLDEIHTPLPQTNMSEKGRDLWSPIQQGLVNQSPDVDAIWRLVLDRPFDFEQRKSIYLSPGNWCPFNTQSTWWWPAAYPLLYIPSYCSFRMCDIWKSFIAQRCLWELNAGVTFHAPEVIQERNAHDLLKDFQDEISGYTRNAEFSQVLKNTTLASGRKNVVTNLRTCYEALVEAKFFPEKELELLNEWLAIF
jgi:hypothetical protein